MYSQGTGGDPHAFPPWPGCRGTLLRGRCCSPQFLHVCPVQHGVPVDVGATGPCHELNPALGNILVGLTGVAVLQGFQAELVQRPLSSHVFQGTVVGAADVPRIVM